MKVALRIVLSWEVNPGDDLGYSFESIPPLVEVMHPSREQQSSVADEPCEKQRRRASKRAEVKCPITTRSAYRPITAL
ncbi:hypothetical protein T265_11587 [Opisthorchis viverrini]|uniref:Uncharacterized protein n=1 Tax=Opisthorchis viverrini TaxID=6198 RepID=A0A074YYJ4_OPIVI|nr:hypothetical protein T265_11585 [Opisthorchis viverrini]XP_009176540.1 hypothetical protein T265_11587 [Opisthorchis viverrini]KER19716.1 hypothetical protein T265_11585 [Opisthorchis viverrini]KER19718.1 hypothetical protein T265_11587 [Opisthorchis viverrini]